MKKILSLSLSTVITAGALLAQPCTPVDTTTSGGILPLPCAKPGVNYNETTTVTLPTNTTVGPLTVFICQVTVNNVDQLPPGSWMWELYKDGNQVGLGQQINLNPQNNQFERACLRFLGNGSVAGSYNIKVSASARVHASNTCTPASFVLQIDTAFYIPFEINPSCSASEEEMTVNSNSFSVSQNSPNPTSDFTQISFTLPRHGMVQLRMASVTGAVVEQKNIMGQAGLNQYQLNLRHLPAGIYTYSLSFQGKTITKRFVHLGK